MISILSGNMTFSEYGLFNFCFELSAILGVMVFILAIGITAYFEQRKQHNQKGD